MGRTTAFCFAPIFIDSSTAGISLKLQDSARRSVLVFALISTVAVPIDSFVRSHRVTCHTTNVLWPRQLKGA